MRFDTALRGYRMTQVDQAMRRAAYDIGYKAELIGVLEAEVTALRDGRIADATRFDGPRAVGQPPGRGGALALGSAGGRGVDHRAFGDSCGSRCR